MDGADGEHTLIEGVRVLVAIHAESWMKKIGFWGVLAGNHCQFQAKGIWGAQVS